MPRNKNADQMTDEALAELEKRIENVYRQASEEMKPVIDDFFKHFETMDGKMKVLIGQQRNGKTWTEEDYKQWRLNQIGRGKRLEALRDKLAKRMTDAREVANAYVNDATPGIYSLNRNYAAYEIESVSPNADFTLWDEQTVKRLIVEAPDVMPYYPEERAVKRGIDLEYGKRQITASITSSILQGRSIKAIADDLQTRITTMNRVSAVRAARTATTNAQNAGRMDSYKAASDMGITVTKRWVANKDLRTRHDHGEADGQVVAYDKPFIVGGYKMMFPGDDTLGAPGNEVYNCRCTMVTAQDDEFEAEPHMMRSKDPETGRYEVTKWKTYQEWYEEKRKQQTPEAWTAYVKAGKNYQKDKREYSQWQEAIGRKAPRTLAEYQKMKYLHPEKWKELKKLLEKGNGK